MTSAGRRRALRVAAAVLAAMALVLFGAGFALVRAGACPAPGAGSLGHVGFVVAGIGAVFIAIVSALFALYCLLKSRESLPREEQGRNDNE